MEVIKYYYIRNGRYDVSAIMRSAWRKVRFYKRSKKELGWYLKDVWYDAKREMERWEWNALPVKEQLEILDKAMPCRNGFDIRRPGSDNYYRDSSWRCR